MKNVNVTFTDEEHKELLTMKGQLSWHEWILGTARMKPAEWKKHERRKK